MRGICLTAAICVVTSAGCNDGQGTSAELAPTPLNVRAVRIAYSGAPPVIPHRPQTGKCITCHSATGSAVPGLGIAPANPHTKTSGLSTDARCRQCHVFTESQEVFVENEFAGLSPRPPRDKSLAPVDPPIIPHHQFMREDCAACHTGKAVRPEIRCTHPERLRCEQCHIPDRSLEPREFQSIASPLANVR